MREQAITLLALWGWEPVEYGVAGGPNIVRLLHRGELRGFATARAGSGTWRMVSFDASEMWQWQPCEWARFSTWTLRRCIKLIRSRNVMAELNWVKAWPIVPDREHMIGWLSLRGWAPVLRRAGDMNQLEYVGIEAPDGHLWIETIIGSVDHVSTPRQPGKPVVWMPGGWERITDKLLHGFFLQVHNHEP